MNRGFIIVAQNSEKTDYLKCATILAKSIKKHMPMESITLLTDKEIKISPFDNVVLFPVGDRCLNNSWKLENDWQVYDASPYDYTIKIESDIYLPRNIEYWWDILKHRDLVISTTIRNFKNEISSCRYYRKIFDDNNLPDVYNALTYFKKSETAKIFYEIVRYIFENWIEFKKLIKCYDTEFATTDVVYGIAAKIIGVENCTLPQFKDMSMIHMKSEINGGIMQDWSKEFIYEISKESFRINTIPQLYPLHYHIKKIADLIEEDLEWKK